MKSRADLLSRFLINESARRLVKSERDKTFWGEFLAWNLFVNVIALNRGLGTGRWRFVFGAKTAVCVALRFVSDEKRF